MFRVAYLCWRKLSCLLKYLPQTSQENVTSGLLWVRSCIIKLYGLVNRLWQYLQMNSHFGRILRRKSDRQSSLSIRITANIMAICCCCCSSMGIFSQLGFICPTTHTHSSLFVNVFKDIYFINILHCRARSQNTKKEHVVSNLRREIGATRVQEWIVFKLAKVCIYVWLSLCLNELCRAAAAAHVSCTQYAWKQKRNINI